MAPTYAGYTADTIINKDTGLPVTNATVSFFQPGTQTPAVTYSSRTKASTVSTVTTNDVGWYAAWLIPGFYDRKVGATTQMIRVNEDDADTVSVDMIDVTGGVAGYTTMLNAVAGRVSPTDLTTALAAKADTSALAGKVDTATLANYVPLSQKGAANGVAALGPDGKLIAAQSSSTSSAVRTKRVWSLENDFGGIGNGVFDNKNAFTAAWAAMSTGDVLTLGTGIFATSAAVAPTRGHVVIEGAGAPHWPYNETGDTQVFPTCIRAIGTFTGNGVLWGRDRELNGGVDVNNCTIRDITIDGASLLTNLPSVLLEGEVKGWRFDNVTAMQSSGHNFETRGYASTRGTVVPRGGYFDHCVAWSAGKSTTTDRWGFYLDTYTDASITNCLAVSNQGGGFYFKSPGQLAVSNTLSVYNINQQGFYITGSTGNGAQNGGNSGISLVNCFTDRNNKDGLLIDLYGVRSRVSIIGGDYRRDGANVVSGNETGGGGYAGVALRGTSANPVCYVDLIGVMTGVEDGDPVNGVSNNVWAPQYGVVATYAPNLKITGGSYWGNTSGASVTNSDGIKITDTTTFIKGAPNATAPDFPDIARGRQSVTTLINNNTWGVTSASTRFRDSPNYYMQMDLRGTNYAKLTAQVTTAASSSAVLNAEYSTDSGSTWAPLSLNNLAVGTTGYKTNAAFKVIPTAAKTDVLVRVTGSGGDGTTQATFASINFHGRP